MICIYVFHTVLSCIKTQKVRQPLKLSPYFLISLIMQYKHIEMQKFLGLLNWAHLKLKLDLSLQIMYFII